MLLTVQQIWDAVPVVSTIIREKRALPQRGKYLLARMHAKLMVEYTPISEQRDKLIEKYQFHNGEAWAVPEDKMPEFTVAWDEMAGVEVDVDVQAIPFTALDLGPNTNGGVEAVELMALGDLVAE